MASRWKRLVCPRSSPCASTNAMPFARIVQELVDRVDSAYGAVFLDDEGEAICHATNGHGMEPDTLDFIGARQGVLVTQLRRLLDITRQGHPRSVLLEGERMTILTRPVEDEYLLVFVLAPGRGTAHASFEMSLAVQQLAAAL